MTDKPKQEAPKPEAQQPQPKKPWYKRAIDAVGTALGDAADKR